jgi:SAM-dependent methyltransferase
MRRSTILSNLPVQASDFVVEIGAGPIPFHYTRLIIDKYPDQNLERYDDTKNAAPIIKADAVRLPLADQACDLLFMSHVIEHLPDPVAFFSEAKRCAKAIYLEFPKKNRELMYAWSFHRWLVEIDGGRLMFYRNDVPQLFGNFFHTQHDFLLNTWTEEKFELLNAHLYTKTEELNYQISEKTAFEHILEGSPSGDQKINYESMYGQSGAAETKYPLDARLKMIAWSLSPGFLFRLRNQISRKRNRGARMGISQDIVERMICVHCGTAKLQLERAEQITCKSCGKTYLAHDQIFDFDIG